MSAPDSRAADPASVSVRPAASPPATPAAAGPVVDAKKPQRRSGRRAVVLVAIAVALVTVAFVNRQAAIDAFTTVSTDDAFVNSHVTFVAPRVSGQVSRVLAEDNNRVRKGDLLVELDDEPYRVKVAIAKAVVEAAQADLTVATARTRALEGQARSLRFNLQHAIEQVHDQIAVLRSRVAALESKRATLARAKADLQREIPLLKSEVISQHEFDAFNEACLIAQAQVDEADEAVQQARVALGLAPKPAEGENLASVPPDHDQTFSAVKQAQAQLMEAASELGITGSLTQTPQEMVDEFYRRDPEGNIDRIYAALLKEAPAVKQAETRLQQAQRSLEEDELHLRFCRVVAEIDGVVTRRSVNPGNNVVAGESMMAIRSVTDVWIEANFKETQLAEIRIGHLVDLDVDMYGKHERFTGRVTGFSVGTGSSLSLLPPENATGNFVKVVQRLPVRIDLQDYDPERTPLFVGLSVTPRVRVREAPSGNDAGKVLQPYLPSIPEPNGAAGKP